MFIFYLSILALLLAYAIYKANDSSNKLDRRMEEEWKKLNRQRKENLTTDIAEWLDLLMLPELEEKTKRLEVANQLSTVLLERLLLERTPD